MKKLYASLALVAAGAIAASAATAPVQENFTTVKRAFGEKVYSLSDAVPAARIADKVAKINNRYSANRAAAAFEGDYLTTGVGFFDGYEANGTFTVREGGYLHGFLGWADDVNFIEAIKFTSEIKATVDANGNVVIALGQVLGTMNGTPIELFSANEKDELTLTGNVTFTPNGEGAYTCDAHGLGYGYNTGNGYSCFSYEIGTTMMKPNATVTYHWVAGNGSDNGNFSVPAYIGFEDEEYEGMTFTSMYMSAILYELSGDGYPASYEVEETDNGLEAIANSPICVYNEDNNLVDGGNITYGQLASSIKTYTPDVIWNLNSDKSEIELSVQELTNQSGQKGNTEGLYIHNDTYTFGNLLDVQVAMMAGVEDIIADAAANNENAPVEYYNLQGMKINNPAAGQIVIRRQGNKTSKMIVR